jgi:hypothetical protein
MRVTLGLATLLCVGMASQAFAADPPSAAPASEAATSASQPTPDVATAATPSAASADKPSSDSTLNDKEIKALRAQGYRPVVRNGETLYCRDEAPLGSRFEKRVCNTADQLAELARNSQENTVHAQRNTSGVPPKAAP